MTCMLCPFRVIHGAIDPPPVSPRFPTVYIIYNVDSDAQGVRDLSNIPPSGKVDVRKSLPAGFIIIRDHYVEYLVEVPTSADDFLKLALRDTNYLREQRKLLPVVDGGYRTIQFSEASEGQIKSLQPQMSSYPARLGRCNPISADFRCPFRKLTVNFQFIVSVYFNRVRA